MHCADSNTTKDWVAFDNVSVCEKEITRATPEKTHYFKEIQFSVTDSHGVTHTPVIEIELLVNRICSHKLLKVGVEKIKTVEFQNKLIILASLHRTMKFLGEPCGTSTALLFLPASSQKKDFLVGQIDNNNMRREIIRKGFNGEYKDMPFIIQPCSFYSIQKIPSTFDHIDEAFKDNNNSAQQ